MSSSQENEKKLLKHLIDTFLPEFQDHSFKILSLFGWEEEEYDYQGIRYLSVTFKTKKSSLYQKFTYELNRCNYNVEITDNRRMHMKGYSITINFNSITKPVIQQIDNSIAVATLEL
jgi:hypothetical protein